MTTSETALTRKVILYSFNYEPQFIAKAFADEPRLAEHFQCKFSAYYNRFGNGEQAFLWLWTSMSHNHQDTLASFIDRTFNN